MAENTTIRDSFFDSLAKGAKWDVGVSINRTNPLPLDQYSVFKTETELDTYIAGAFSYPGQIVALVGEAETVIYYLAEKADHSGLEKIEVGSMPGVDNNSIEIKIDETTGDEYLTLVGLEDAKAGASLIKGTDGKIAWSTTTQSELNADLTAIKADIADLDKTVYGYTDTETQEIIPGHDDRIEALEEKFDSMGAIFNYRGAITVGDNDTIDTVIDFIPVAGDVVLVNGKQEYVYAEGNWEPFGDPHGVETLANTVAGHTSSITDLQGRMTDAENTIGLPKIPANPDEGEAGRDASGLYAYVDEVATEKANAAKEAAEAKAEELVSPVRTKANQNAEAITGLRTDVDLKATTTYVDGQISAVSAEVAKKADLTYVNEELAKKATKDELTNGLALKADKTTFETVTGEHTTKIGVAEQKITALETAVGQVGEDGKYPTTSLTGRVAALEATDITHNQDIGNLKTGLGSITDDSTASTAFGKAAEAKALATAANTAAGTAQAKADSAYTLADTANKAAGVAQGEVDALELIVAEKVDKTTYDSKVEELEGKIQANTTAVSTKAEKTYVDEELAKKVDQTAYDTKVGELNGAIALKASTEYVDGELAKKADKTATENAISEINAKIGTLGNVMNFVGELEEVDGKLVIKVAEGAEAKTPENGDVGFFGAFEYVYINNEWVKFGDTSAEGGRISALETAVGNLDNSGLIKDVADLKAEDVSIKATADALSTSVDSRFATVNETLTSLGTNKVDVSVYNEKIAALEAADAKEAKDRDDAVKAEASARAAAISALDTYYQNALSWGEF